jgi:hypothetical protein
VVFAALTTLLVCSVVASAPVGAATFTFVGSLFRSCWEDTEGFTAAPDLQPNPLPGGSPTGTHFMRFTTQGNSRTVVFNTDGTVAVTEDISTAIRNTTSGRVGGSSTTCNGTWTFDAGTQVLSTDSTCNFTGIVGGANSGTITNAKTTYRVAGTTLVLLEPTTPVVETVNVLTGNGAPFSYDRVCGRSGSLYFVQ